MYHPTFCLCMRVVAGVMIEIKQLFKDLHRFSPVVDNFISTIYCCEHKHFCPFISIEAKQSSSFMLFVSLRFQSVGCLPNEDIIISLCNATVSF